MKQEYVDARTRTLNKPVEQQLTEYVKEMVQDMKKTYVNREKQLSQAVREYRGQAGTVAKKHEQLMVAYRYLGYKCYVFVIMQTPVGFLLLKKHKVVNLSTLKTM